MQFFCLFYIRAHRFFHKNMWILGAGEEFEAFGKEVRRGGGSGTSIGRQRQRKKKRKMERDKEKRKKERKKKEKKKEKK